MFTELRAEDGRQIKLFSWLPQSEIHHSLIISHGMAEHIHCYEEFASTCRDAGIAVYGANHRGHGDDAEKQGHYADQNGWHLVQDDLNMIVDHVKAQHDLPVVLLGHSMGSFVAQNYAINHGKKLDGLILSGSNYQAPFMYQIGKFVASIERMRIGAATPSPFLGWLSFGSFNKKFKQTRTDFDWLSSNPTSVDRYIADAYCGFDCTPQFWIDFLSGLNTISQPNAFSVIPTSLPIYVFSGDKDPVGLQGKGVLALIKQLQTQSGAQVDHLLYPDGRHEMLNEVNAKTVYQNVIDWIATSVKAGK